MTFKNNILIKMYTKLARIIGNYTVNYNLHVLKGNDELEAAGDAV